MMSNVRYQNTLQLERSKSIINEDNLAKLISTERGKDCLSTNLRAVVIS